MEAPIYWNWLAFSCLAAAMVIVRMRQEEMSREIDSLRRTAHHILRGQIMDNRNFQFMFYGFFAAWAIIGSTSSSLGLRESKLRRELDRVRRMVEPQAK